MAESATLNAGQCQPKAWKSRKSTTWPKRSRSMRLPSAPPRISASPPQNIGCGGERKSSTLTMTAATREKATNSGVCQPGASARKLNAAPLLNTRTRSKKPLSARRSPGAKLPSTAHLAAWSATTIAAAVANQRQFLGIQPFFAGSVQVAAAAAAERLVVDVRTVMPAALAFAVQARRDLHAQLCARAMHAGGGGEHHELEILAEAAEQLVVAAAGVEIDLGLQRRADLAGRAQLLDFLAHWVAQLAQALPLRQQLRAVLRARQRVPGLEEHAVVALSGKYLPELLGGEAQDRRHQPHQAVGDVVERGLRRATGKRVGLARVEPVLEDVEEERAEVLGAERLQLLRHQVKLLAIVVRGDLLLRARRHGERIAVDLEQLVDRHGVPRGVEVRGVGEQEAQRVAHAAIALHHVLQDLVGDEQLARVVRARHPQPQDLRAQRMRHLLRRDYVALRFRHLAALAVDDEAVGEERLVGRDAIQHARDQQRRMEPAAVLVGALEVQMRREAGFLLVRAAQHGVMRRAGIEPDVERVAALLVLRCLGADQFFAAHRLPGLDAGALDALRHFLEQLGRARVQLARLAVQEKRHRHAPLALPRQRPVRAIGDHALQPCLAPGRKELGLLDAAQRRRAQ